MSMFDPAVSNSRPLQDVVPEGEPFILKAAKIVATGNKQYGNDRMVVLTIAANGGELEVSIWGKYLLAQVESMQPRDLPKEVRQIRQHVEGFGRNPVKMLVPTTDDEIPY